MTQTRTPKSKSSTSPRVQVSSCVESVLSQVMRRVTTAMLANATMGETATDILVVRELLSGRNLAPGCHVGRKDLVGEELVEWYAGQFLAVFDAHDAFAMHSLLQACERFCALGRGPDVQVVKSLGQVAYEAFGSSSDGWARRSETAMQRWNSVAKAVIAANLQTR